MSERDQHEEMDDELEALLGAYALDAVDDVERRRVERLVANSPDAQAELARLTAAVDQIAEAAAAGARAPEGLLGSIMAGIAEREEDEGHAAGTAPTPPPAAEPVILPSASVPPTTSNRRASSGGGVPSRGSSRATWVLSAAAVVLLFVVGAIVVGTRGDDGPTDSVAAMEQMAADASTMSGSRVGSLTDADNTMAVEVVVDPEGHAFVMSGVLPALDDDHTYQLWSAEGDTMVSIGLLGSAPTMSVVGVDSSVTVLAITVEPVGGSPGPTSDPMASGTLATV